MSFSENSDHHQFHLCYGDLITFENPQEKNSFIFSDGFLKTKLNMKTFDEASSSKVDFSSFIFQVYPQFANTNKSQALHFAEELEASKATGQQRKEKIEAMQEKLTDEYSFNLETFNKHKNVSITYGKIVQFMHILSNKFLSVSFVEADIEKENYKISLEEYSSESTFFKILPSYKYQKESEGRVFLEDIVFIACAGSYLNKIPYLHCSNTRTQIREKKTGPSFFQTNYNNIQFHSKYDPTKQQTLASNTGNEAIDEFGTVQQKGIKAISKPLTEINASLDTPTHWRIHLFSKIIEDNLKDFLSYGDVIWLNNLDKRISLLGRFGKKSSLKKIGDEFVKDPYFENNALEVLFTNSLISEGDNVGNLGNTNGMWVIENADATKGGLILATDPFRLKHLPTGKYLAGTAVTKDLTKYEIVAIEDVDEGSLFSLTIVQEPKPKGVSQQDLIKYVSKDAFIMIKHKKTSSWLGIAGVKMEKGEIAYPLSLNKTHNDEDVLKIARANTTELLETNFLKSCKNLLMKYVVFLFKLQKKSITVYEIKMIERKTENVSKCLKDLELFVTNQLFNTSPYIKFGSINQRRQKILREQYYIEMLIHLLLSSMNKFELEKYSSLKEQAKENKDLESRRGSSTKKSLLKNLVSKMKDGKSGDQIKIQEDRNFLRLNSIKLRIVKLIFRLFIYICKDFEENEFYIYDLLPTFNYYFEYASAAIDFLISLVRNNETIMKKVSSVLGSLSLSSIEKLSSILEMELTNQEDVSKEANIVSIANNLKIKMKKNELIEEFIQTISQENAAGNYFNKSKTLSLDLNNERAQYEEEFKQMKNNLILLFAAIAKKTYKKERNIKLLKFFRTICSHQKRGITSNQEVLSKIFKNEAYHRAFLIKINIDNQIMRIEHTDGKTLFFEDIFLKELREKREYLISYLENDIEEDINNSNISLANKSKIDATFQSFDKATSSIFPMKEEEKDEQLLVTQNHERDMRSLIEYLNEQITFYSDLCLGRNYIWKRTLEAIFPIQFVFAQIYNKKIFKETRSAFTRLALSLYIDQQPFSPANYPNLCRIYKKESIIEGNIEVFPGDEASKTLEKKVFEGLLKASLEYIKAKSLKINQSLFAYEKKNIPKEEKKDNFFSPTSPPKPIPTENETKFKNYLNNMLLLDILQMVSKLLSFNLFELIQQEDTYLTFFPYLISLLEFDYSNPLISLAVINKREKLFKELVELERKKENIMATGLSGIKSLFSEVMENVTGLTKEMAGTLLGTTGPKLSKKKENKFLDRYNETFLYSHPLMRSCVSQRNKLSLLGGEEEGKVYKVEKELKILALEIIKQFLFMRHDFLITNFLAWYQTLTQKDTTYNEEKIRNEINENLMTVLPEILKVGISFVDMKYQIKEDENVLNNVGNNLKNFVGNIGNLILQEEDTRYLQKKFRVYTKEKELRDLDSLLVGNFEEGYNISKTLYPSLIMMFYTNQDPSLTSKFLEIIMLCFHQREKFSDTLKNLELLFDKADVENYLHISKTVRYMQSICEKTEVWISEWLSNSQVPQELLELKKIMSFLIMTFYSKDSKEKESELEIEEIDKKEEDNEEEFIVINPVRQKMSLFLGIHLILIDFLKDTMHLMEKILKDEHIQLKEKEMFLSLYKKVFLWLKYFVKENSNNQEELYEYINQFFSHMDLDLGQIDLVCEIFRNNQTLCENIRTKIINEFIGLINKIGRREKFLTFFEIIQTVNNSYVFDTQAKVINALLGGNVNNSKDLEQLKHLLYVKTNDNELIFDFEIKPLNEYFNQNKQSNAYKTQFSECLYGDKPYKYHAKLLKVLSLTSQGIQGFNLSNARLRKLLSLPFIFINLAEKDGITSCNSETKLKISPGLFLENDDDNNDSKNESNAILSYSKKINNMRKERLNSKMSVIDYKDKSDGINILKPALIQYIIDVYLPTIKKEKDEFQEITSFIQMFLEFEVERFKNLPENELKNDRYKEYFFTGVLKFLHSYTNNIVTPSIIIENIERKDNEILFELAENLVKRLPQMQNSLPSVQVKNLQDFIRLYFEENEEMNANIDKCLEEDEKKPVRNYSQSNMSMLTEVFEEGMDNSASWKAFLKLCIKSDCLEKETEREKKALCESFIKIHSLFDEEEKKKYNINIVMKDILQKLVDYIQFSISHRENRETIAYTLEILIKIVNIYPKKEEIQNIFDQINTLSMIFTVIAETKTNPIQDDIFDNLLSFLISLLEGGNQNSQKSAYNYFITIPTSEYIFEKFYLIINDQIEEIKANKHNKKEVISKKKFSVENENLKKSILEKILRIMQMLTEGHYLEMQLYLREQSNSRNSYDLVSSVIELLYVYHADLGVSNYYNILRCFETLTEVVQGPCTANQNALIEGKFLEIAFTILSTNVPKFKQNAFDKNIKSRKTVAAKEKKKRGQKLIELSKTKKNTKTEDRNQLKRWMLERIKYKCMILVCSLLEMKQGYNVVKRVIRSLPLEVLKRNLSDIYRRYKKKYGATLQLKKESLKKFEEDPEDKNNKKSLSEYELIIETGFLTFFLINEYLEIIHDPELDFDDPIQGNQKDNLLKGSIIGQLGSLGLTLMKSGLDTVSVVGRVVNQKIIQQMINSDDGDDVEKEKLKKEMRTLELKGIMAEALKFFNNNSGHIEVLRGKNLEKVYFMLPTYCHFLPEETKNEFNENVDRTSLESKLEELVKESDEIIRIAKHEEKLAFFFNQNKILAIFASYVSLWKELAFFMNIVLNIFIIFSFSDYSYTELSRGYIIDSQNNQTNITSQMIWDKRMNEPHLMGLDEYSETDTKQIMSICGIVMIICAGFVVLFFLCKKAPLYIEQSWGKDEKKDDDEEEQIKKKKPLSIRIFQLIKRVATCLVKFLLNVDVIYYLAYAALAILGVAVHQFFFCFHLTELFFRFPTLKNVVKSVYEPREALLLTLVLWIILEYVFSIWAFQYLRDQYTSTENLNDSFCTELLICFLYTFDFTFKSNGGIGSQLDSLRGNYIADHPELPKYTATRFFFDNLFTIVIVIIMITIVAGIIIDTFGLLRDNENSKLKDMERICFMCGLNKEIFERQVDLKKGFNMHISKEHFQWNYVYFIAFLKDKDPGEYTGVESFIAQKLESKDLSWFPKFRALSLKNIEEGEDELHHEFINKCEEDFDHIKKNTLVLKETLGMIIRSNNMILPNK